MKPIKIEGRNAVLEALINNIKITDILIDTNARPNKRLNEILKIVSHKGIRIKRVDRKYLDKISDTGVHMGIIAFAERPELPTTVSELLKNCKKRNKDPFVIVIDGLLHQQNIGAIVRTANAAGVDGVVISKNTKHSISPEIIRISMGAALFTPIIKESIHSVIKILKRNNVYVVSADMDGAKPYYEINLKGSIALVLGGEHKGLSDPIKKKCDEIVRIPMLGIVSSLNVSVACAILAYEKVRQEGIK